MSWLLVAVSSRFAGGGRGKCIQQPHGLAEPGTFFAAQVPRQGDLLIQDALRPFACLIMSSLLGEECRVIELRLGEGGNIQRLAKEAFSFFSLTNSRIAVGEQPGGALIIELTIEPHHPFEV